MYLRIIELDTTLKDLYIKNGIAPDIKSYNIKQYQIENLDRLKVTTEDKIGLHDAHKKNKAGSKSKSKLQPDGGGSV
jgi:hypothetical protein